MVFDGKNTIVLDLETARSAEDCQNCGQPKEAHKVSSDYEVCPHHEVNDPIAPWTYEPIGWNNKPALGLSIGGYYSYVDDRVYWFDEANLFETMSGLVAEQPLMVSFNGIQFDFPLMRGILRRRADAVEQPYQHAKACDLREVCDAFKKLAACSYDILAEIWRADPSRKFERNLNSLDAISQANGLGAKLSHGAQAPRDWAAGRHEDVLNYCQDDVMKTKALFEMICAGKPILRGDGNPIQLRIPDIEKP